MGAVALRRRAADAAVLATVMLGATVCAFCVPSVLLLADVTDYPTHLTPAVFGGLALVGLIAQRVTLSRTTRVMRDTIILP